MWLIKPIEWIRCYNDDIIQVGYLLHDTKYRHNETALSNRERQYITMTTTGLYNIQELRMHLNWSAINENSPPTFNIVWGGRTSGPVAVNNITDISSESPLLPWL